MALTNCKECGKEISDTVKKCPHCGYVNKELKEEKIEKGKRFIHKYNKIIVTIIIALVICIGGYIGYNKKIEQDRIKKQIIANTLTDDEKMIARVVNKLQTSLKNPESLQVFEIIYSKADDSSATVIIDSSGQNGFGGVTRRRNMYLIKSNGTITYWGDDSNADKTVTKYTSTEDKLEIATSKVVKEYWTERKDFFVVDVDKIMRNLDQAN